MVDSPSGRVLVVDDDRAVGTVLIGLLRQGGLEAEHVTSAQAALEEHASYDVVLTDLRMPGMDGLELMRELRRRTPELPVVMLTAHGSVPVAVEAMKAGAADFMTKPFDRKGVLYTIRKALAAAARRDSEPPKLPTPSLPLLGGSAPMRECVAVVERAARSAATALIRGESGTGKELAARSIHDQGPRREGPFVVVNCAALPDELLENELFGHEKGAFTGATTRKPGRVNLAEGGTLFLDEIGDNSAAVQVKLLRLLQERQYEPLGGTQTKQADVRFVAATHRDLEAMIETSEFRQDLYYRLNVIPIWMPPLRERLEDIPELAARFCKTLARDNGREGLRLSEAAVARLGDHSWPGNVRELQNFVERLVVFTDGDVIDEAEVTRELSRFGGPPSSSEPQPPPGPTAPAEPAPSSDAQSLAARRSEAERAAVLEALDRTRGNRTQAARLLGVSRRTFYKRLNDFGIR